ncbi:hypothetical protein WDV85_10400 [Pseudokineococcus sp. 5B2Z-1]|uniref:hypothetical protein n=1 Tax=Pseudokineococcus sp. 5B2Z-1 TaxID=3132744 RepID=UPI0030B6A13F
MTGRGRAVAAALAAAAAVVVVAVAATGGPALEVGLGPVPEVDVEGAPGPAATPLPSPSGTRPGLLPADVDVPGPDLALVLALPLLALVVAAVAALLLARRTGARGRTGGTTTARPATHAVRGAEADVPAAGSVARVRARHVVGGERASVVRLWEAVVGAAAGTGSPRQQERLLAERAGSAEGRAAAAELRSLYEEAAFAAADPPPDRWARAQRCADVLVPEAAPLHDGDTPDGDAPGDADARGGQR